MRIGILTVPFNNNFGGFLQAYALKTVLTQLGHEVIIINRRRNRYLSWRGKIKLFLTKTGIIKSHDKILSVNTNIFIKKYLTPGTPYYYTSKDLKKCLKYEFDAFIVGSDQVWRYKYAQDSIDDFFFGFLKDTDIPRISYAASFGVDSLNEYPEDKKKICGELLKDFSGISVREESGIKLIEEMGCGINNPKVVLDPTLLLTTDYYYENLIKPYCTERPEDGYIFNYILDNSEQSKDISDLIEQKHNLKSIKLQAQTGEISMTKPIAPVEEWLRRIYYADFVVTDSFHGTVFSILFNKPFVVIGNLTRGLTRLESLLKMFGLENRMVRTVNDIGNSIATQDIDWTRINKEIDKCRLTSSKFLHENIQKI